MDSLDEGDRNPYHSPAIGDVAIRPPNDAAPTNRALSRVLRFGIFVPVMIAHLYFLAMLFAWSQRWVSGQNVPTQFREFGMYSGAVVCAIGSAIVLYGLARNRRLTTYLSASVSVLSFMALLMLEML